MAMASERFLVPYLLGQRADYHKVREVVNEQVEKAASEMRETMKTIKFRDA